MSLCNIPFLSRQLCIAYKYPQSSATESLEKLVQIDNTDKIVHGIRKEYYQMPSVEANGTLSALLNSLVNIYGLAPGGKGDRFDKLDGKSNLALEFAPQVPMYSARIFFTESVGWYDTQNSLSRRLLHELELSYVEKCIIVHIQSRPRNFGAIGCDQYFLDPVATDVSNESVLTPAHLAMLTDISSPISGSISDERHDGIDKAGSYNLAALARAL